MPPEKNKSKNYFLFLSVRWKQKFMELCITEETGVWDEIVLKNFL
jgi:hypothetical protein